jgi:riboflavin synthase
MFTGLVTTTGTIRSADASSTGMRLEIAAPAGWLATPAAMPSPTPPLILGESIAVHGCCLTLARLGAGLADDNAAPPAEGEVLLGFDAIPETLRVTRLGRLAPGRRVHLERSATPSTLLGGHLVQGHVDGLGHVVAVLVGGGEWRVRIAIDAPLLGGLVLRGSIAVDGVSLTIAGLDDAAATFDVCLIPETLARTTLGELVAGDAVHVEVDCISKMVARQLALRGQA